MLDVRKDRSSSVQSQTNLKPRAHRKGLCPHLRVEAGLAGLVVCSETDNMLERAHIHEVLFDKI